MVLICLSLSSYAQPVAGATASSCSSGAIIPSPSPGPYIGLFGVSALGGSDVWSVGYYIKTDQNDWFTLIEHWNGRRWSVVPGARTTPNGVLNAVTALSASDAWAVGEKALDSVSNPTPLIEHWNGSAWSAVPDPPMHGFLDGVAAASPDDIWAVGSRRIDNGLRPDKTLVEHWDGTHWTVVPSPNITPYGAGLAAVTVAGSSDIWATGQAGTSRNDSAPLAEHWNGKAWSAVSMPTLGFTSGMRGITSKGPNDVWTVGWYDVQSNTGTLTYTLAERWDGRGWSVVATPSPTGDDLLDGVAAVSSTDIWAVGATAYNRTFVLRWNGHGWTTLPSLYLRGAVNILWAVSASAPTDIWAAGGGYRTLIEHICPTA